MPIYAYQCADCNENFELFVRSLTAKIDAVCPQCGSEHVAKAVTTVSALGMSGASGYASAAASAACAPSG